MKKTSLYIVSLVVLIGFLGIMTMLVGTHPPVHATANCPYSGSSICLGGWAWSSNIGWISFNSNNVGAAGGTYDVGIDAGTGTMTGYAWSSNIGWIKFGGLSGMPTGSGNARLVSTTTGQVTGWARACAGTASGDCSSMTPRTDGWDGWIELSGTHHTSPVLDGSGGVTYASESFKGYAWNSDVIGWIQFTPLVIPPSGTPTTTPTTCTGCGGPTPPQHNFTMDITDLNNINWGSSATVQAQSDGTAIVRVRWSAVGIDAASTTSAYATWNALQGSDNVSGMYLNQDNLGGINITYTGITSVTTKVLSVGYMYSLGPFTGVSAPKSVTVTINPYVPNNPPPVNCSAPANSVGLCSDSTTGASSNTTVNNGACSSSVVTVCKFECLAGYKAQGGMCVRSTIQEI